MTAYYNEFEPYAAQWLRNLIAAGHIAPGDVDERSILDVKAEDLKGYTQCHFFAGIGGWSLALRLANWPDDRSVWTGSPPCQPFSAAAGKLKKAQSDERHLWPHFARLICERRPPVLLGEQVDDAIAHGWLDDAFHDLEISSYSCAAAVLPACGADADTRRERIFFVAHASFNGQPQSRQRATSDATLNRREDHKPVDANKDGYEWLACNDGRKRRIKSGVRLLIDRVPSHMGRLRAYGNAIDPRIAAEFIKAVKECIP